MCACLWPNLHDMSLRLWLSTPAKLKKRSKPSLKRVTDHIFSFLRGAYYCDLQHVETSHPDTRLDMLSILINSRQSQVSVATREEHRMKIGIIYGSTTGNTEDAANLIGKQLEDAAVHNITDVDQQDFEQYDLLILGTSTWGMGDMQDDWEDGLSKLSQADLQGKQVALFGLGDQNAYPGTFVDALRGLYDAAIQAGARVIGRWPAQEYSFSDSEAQEGNELLGLALDYDNEDDLTEDRIINWLKKVMEETA